MKRLGLSILPALPAAIARPRYEPRAIGIGIVHLGIGAFHRAQTAVYSDDALALERGEWGICGVSLRSAGVRGRVMGSVREVLFLGDQRHEVHSRLVAPSTRIVTLTITEKGYCHDPAT